MNKYWIEGRVKNYKGDLDLVGGLFAKRKNEYNGWLDFIVESKWNIGSITYLS